MSEQHDDRIVELLQRAAPPARDAIFRLRVLERREQRQFQRRLYIMLVGVIAIILVSTFAMSLGGGFLETSAPVICVAVASTCLAFRQNLMRILRHFRI